MTVCAGGGKVGAEQFGALKIKMFMYFRYKVWCCL